MQSKIVYTLIKKVCEYRVMNYKETPLEKKYNNYNEYKNNNRKLFVNYEQIKSKERVNNHGEVLTPEWLVKDMLDLLPRSVSQIESRYLETSVGEGAFLVEILYRKLNLVFTTFNENLEREFFTVVALCNIYGLELLRDNVEITKTRLEMVIKDFFIDKYNIEVSENFFDVIKKILDINIINMDSMRFKVPMFDENNKILLDSNGEIVYNNELALISEWEFDYENKKVKRIEYYYKDVVNEQRKEYIIKQKKKESIKSSTKVNIWGDVIEKNEEPLYQDKQMSFFECAITNSENELNKTDNISLKPVRIFESVNYLCIK